MLKSLFPELEEEDLIVQDYTRIVLEPNYSQIESGQLLIQILRNDNPVSEKISIDNLPRYVADQEFVAQVVLAQILEVINIPSFKKLDLKGVRLAQDDYRPDGHEIYHCQISLHDHQSAYNGHGRSNNKVQAIAEALIEVINQKLVISAVKNEFMSVYKTDSVHE
jgi:hypothetical protein